MFSFCVKEFIFYKKFNKKCLNCLEYENRKFYLYVYEYKNDVMCFIIIFF